TPGLHPLPYLPRQCHPARPTRSGGRPAHDLIRDRKHRLAESLLSLPQHFQLGAVNSGVLGWPAIGIAGTQGDVSVGVGPGADHAGANLFPEAGGGFKWSATRDITSIGTPGGRRRTIDESAGVGVASHRAADASASSARPGKRMPPRNAIRRGFVGVSEGL